MLIINLDTETGVAKPVTSTPIRVGVDVPIRIQCSAGSPGDNPAFQIALCTDSTPPEVKAFLDVFGEENETTFIGLLNARDPRLVEFMAAKSQTSLNCELRWIVDGPGEGQRTTESAPNFKITVEPTAIQPGEANEGGPAWATIADTYIPEPSTGKKYRLIFNEAGELQREEVAQ